MKTAFLLLSMVMAAASAFAATPAPAPDTGLARRYAEVRSRIETLFAKRNGKLPPIDRAENPFLEAPVAAAASGGGSYSPSLAAPLPAPPSKLQQIVATLRVSGLVQVGGVSQLVINQAPHREGDLITVIWQGTPVFIRVAAITPGIVTFRLDDETVNLRY